MANDNEEGWLLKKWLVSKKTKKTRQRALTRSVSVSESRQTVISKGRPRRIQTFANDRDFYKEIAKDPNAPSEEQLERQNIIRSIIEKKRYAHGKEQLVSYLHVKKEYRTYIGGRELNSEEKGDITEILKDTYATLSSSMRSNSLRSFRTQQRQRDGPSELLHKQTTGDTSEPDAQDDLLERSGPNDKGQAPVPPSNTKLQMSSMPTIRRTQSMPATSSPGTIYAEAQRKLLRFKLQQIKNGLRKQQQRIANSSFASKEKKAIENYTSEVDKLRKWGLDSVLHLFEKQHLMQRRVLNHALQLETIKRSVLKREVKKVEIELKSLAQMGDKTLVFRQPHDNFSLAQIIATADPVRKMQRQLNECQANLKEVQAEIALKRKDGLLRRLRPAQRKAKVLEIITKIVRSCDLTSSQSSLESPTSGMPPLKSPALSEISTPSTPSPRLTRYLSSTDHMMLDDAWIDTSSDKGDKDVTSRPNRIGSSDLPIFEEPSRIDIQISSRSSPSPVPERRKSMPVDGHPLSGSPETTGTSALPSPPSAAEIVFAAEAPSTSTRSQRTSNPLTITIPKDPILSKVWERRAETDSTWTPYSHEHCERLSQALDNGETEVFLTSGRHTYMVNLETMEQRPHPMPFECKTIPQVLVRWAPFMTEAQRKEAQAPPTDKQSQHRVKANAASASRSAPSIAAGTTISLPKSPLCRPTKRHFPTEEEMLRYGLIQDRKWMLKTWRQCFIGDQVVNWMVAHGYARNTKEAEAFGQELVEQGKIRYLLHQKVKFKDTYLFYRWCTTSPRISAKMSMAERPPVPPVPKASSPHPSRGKVPPVPAPLTPDLQLLVEGGEATEEQARATMSPATNAGKIRTSLKPDLQLAIEGGKAADLKANAMVSPADEILSPLTPDLQLSVTSCEVTAAKAHTMMSPSTDADEATAIGSKSSPVPEVESPATDSAAPTETAHKPEADADTLGVKDASSAVSPDVDAPATEIGHVIEELMEEPLTTMAWCGRMPRSESKCREFKTLITDQRFKEGKQVASLKEGILSLGSSATAGSVMTKIFTLGEDLRQRFGVRKNPVGSRVFHLLLEDIVYPDIREIIIEVVNQTDPEWRQKDKAMETRNGWLSFLGAEPAEFGVHIQLAKWAKQHQPDDKIFVQALCEELKALELDPEKEDIWAPNNLLRKFMDWVKSVYAFAERASAGDEIGADDFFPLVIWTLVHAGMKRPHMLLHFMTVFVLDNPHIDEQLQAEAMYYLTVFEASLHWIISLRNDLDSSEYSKLWRKGFTRALESGTLSIVSVATKECPTPEKLSSAEKDVDESGAKREESSAVDSAAPEFELDMNALQSVTLSRAKRFGLVQLVQKGTRPGSPTESFAQLATVQIVAKTDTLASQWVDWIMTSAFDGNFEKKEALLPHKFSSKSPSSESSIPVEPLTAEKVKLSPKPEKTGKGVDGCPIGTGQNQRDDTEIARELFLI